MVPSPRRRKWSAASHCFKSNQRKRRSSGPSDFSSLPVTVRVRFAKSTRHQLSHLAVIPNDTGRVQVAFQDLDVEQQGVTDEVCLLGLQFGKKLGCHVKK